MFKKLLIAAVAVVAGLAVINHSLVKVWWKDACHSVKRMVPPETQLKQLNAEIENIDRDIKKNISRLAAMEADVKAFENDLNGKRVRQARLRTEITALKNGLQADNQKVVFRDETYSPKQATQRLDMAVVEFTSLKEQVKVKEQLLDEKKRTLEVAHNRITEMKTEQERLRLVAVKLANHLELVRSQQIHNQNAIDFDDSSIARCHEIAQDVEKRLVTWEEEAKLLKKYGYKNENTVVEKGKSRDAVLESARKALEDETGDKVAVEKNEE
jgi:chromosome segregation ATPase